MRALGGVNPAREVSRKHFVGVFAFHFDAKKPVSVCIHRKFIDLAEAGFGDPGANHLLLHRVVIRDGHHNVERGELEATCRRRIFWGAKLRYTYCGTFQSAAVKRNVASCCHPPQVDK